MAEEAKFWLIVAGIALAAFFVSRSPGTLFSASVPTVETYDFRYEYKPTVYDSGNGYQQVYPQDLHIGTEFTFSSAEKSVPQVPENIAYPLNDYLKVLMVRSS